MNLLHDYLEYLFVLTKQRTYCDFSVLELVDCWFQDSSHSLGTLRHCKSPNHINELFPTCQVIFLCE